MPNPTNFLGRHSEFSEEDSTCLKTYYRKSGFSAFVDTGFLVQSSQPTLLSQATGRDLVAELLADKRSPNTRRAYERDLNDFFLMIAMSLPTPAMVQEFLRLDRFAAILAIPKQELPHPLPGKKQQCLLLQTCWQHF